MTRGLWRDCDAFLMRLVAYDNTSARDRFGLKDDEDEDEDEEDSSSSGSCQPQNKKTGAFDKISVGNLYFEREKNATTKGAPSFLQLGFQLNREKSDSTIHAVEDIQRDGRTVAVELAIYTFGGCEKYPILAYDCDNLSLSESGETTMRRVHNRLTDIPLRSMQFPTGNGVHMWSTTIVREEEQMKMYGSMVIDATDIDRTWLGVAMSHDSAYLRISGAYNTNDRWVVPGDASYMTEKDATNALYSGDATKLLSSGSERHPDAYVPLSERLR